MMVLAAPFSKAHATPNATDLPWKTGMVPGNGFDSASASSDGLASALDPASIEFGPAVCPFERKFDVELVDNLSEYTQRIGVRAEAEVNLYIASLTGTLAFANTTIKNNHSVYLMLRDERTNCHYRLENPRLTPEAEQQLVTDYPSFRKHYGDSFLSTVSTGGDFYAVLEIHAEDETSHNELMFGLKAKLAGITLFSWELKEVFDDITHHYDASLHVYVNNSALEFGNSTQDFFDRYRAFLSEVSGPVCGGKSAIGWRECTYLKATFEDYQQLTRLPVGSETVELQTTLMDELAQRYQAYADIVSRAETIEANIDAYQYGEEDRSQRLATVRALLADARSQAATLKGAYDACRAAVASCKGSEQLGLMPEISLEQRFPVERDHYPQTCKDLRRKQGVLRDGPVRLYWQGKLAQPIEAYCAGMATAEPSMYLPLRVTSANTPRPYVNFAKQVGTSEDGLSEPLSTTSVFSAVRVEFVNQQAIVLPQAGVLVSDWPVDEKQREVEHVELYATRTCDGSSGHLINLSLKGTPWVISRQSQFDQVAPQGSEAHWTVSPDRKQLDAFGEGRTGCVELSVRGALKLEYQP
jgi:hypothetical protein